MYCNKYFSIEKCDVKAAWTIRLWIIIIVSLTFINATYSPLEFLFKYLGYTESNGCPLLTLFGIPCAICGTGRGFWALIKLDFHGFFYWNPFSPFLFLLFWLIIFLLFIISFFNLNLKLKDSLLKLWQIPVAFFFLTWLLNILFGHY
jgi:hypothetical protein